MITPLAQRQIFQTANIEAVRAAHGVSEQIQREQSHKKSAEDRAAEEQASVQVIPASDKIRTEERRGGQGQGQGNEEEQPPGEDKGEGEGRPPDSQAKNADSHLDLLA